MKVTNNLFCKSKGSLPILIAVGALALIAFLIIVIGIGMMSSLTGNNSGVGNSGGLSCTSSQLTDAQKQQINANMSVYQEAAKKANVPWEFIVAIHYREKTLSTTDQNPFQMNNLIHPGFNVEGAVDAAKHAQAGVKSVYGKTLTASSDEETIKLGFLAYNRWSMYKTGSCTVDQSPYVMNQFDAAHKNMTWPNNSCEPDSVRGNINYPLGAFTVYSILKGCTSATVSGNHALPVDPSKIKGYNNTPHGQSISNPGFKRYHNVFLGPGDYGSNVPNGPGEAVDLYLSGGSPVYMPFDGTVIFSSATAALCGGSCGGFVIAKSSDGKSVSALAHLQNYAKKGMSLKAGEKVGEIYSYSSSHLHFELWVNGAPINAGPYSSSWRSKNIWEAQKKALGF